MLISLVIPEFCPLSDMLIAGATASWLCSHDLCVCQASSANFIKRREVSFGADKLMETVLLSTYNICFG